MKKQINFSFITLIKIIFAFLSINIPITGFGVPTGKPVPIISSNGRTVEFNNRFQKAVCFYPKEYSNTIYPMLDYDSEDVCDTKGPKFYFDIYNRLATKLNNAWYCLNAVSQSDLNTFYYQYMTLTPCVMTELRQRWKYDKALDNFVSYYNQRPLGEIYWTLAQSKTDKGVYALGGVSKRTFSFQAWLDKPSLPVNASYFVRFNWAQRENPFITYELSPKQGYYNPFNKQIYMFIGTTAKCMTSLRVKTGASDAVTWENCDTTLETAKLEHRWTVSPPNNLRSTVFIADGKGNPLVVFNSAYSGVLYGKTVTISANQPSSLPAPFTNRFEIGSDYFGFALAEAKNLMGMVDAGFCPAPGVRGGTKPSIQPRIVPEQVNWRNWLHRMYEIAINDDNASRLGMLAASDLQAMEMIAEATLEGDQSEIFLGDPFGILYDTDTPPGTTYVSIQRFRNQRLLVSTLVEQDFRTVRATLNEMNLTGTITINNASSLYRTHLTNAYNTISPQLSTSLRTSQTNATGLTVNNFQTLFNNLRLLPSGSTFILRATSFPNPGNFTASWFQSLLGIVENNGDIRLVPASMMGRTDVTPALYRDFFNNSLVNSGEEILNWLQTISPQIENYQMLDVYQVDRRFPPTPTTTSIGTQTELSAGNCTTSTQTDMSGDGHGLNQVRMNFCATSSGRCMDR